MRSHLLALSIIVGRYDFDAPPPWRSLKWLSSKVELPTESMTRTDIPGRP
jgi:hypothetical protein